MDLDSILAQLDKVRKSGDGWSARCPAHSDKNNSLSIRRGNDDRVLVHCHAGCSTESISSALGLEMRELFNDLDDRGYVKNQSNQHRIIATSDLKSDVESIGFIVEGEKDCDRLSRLGLLATTNVGGASNNMQMTIYADGLCEPRNPGGFACWAWVAFDNSGQEIANNRGCVGSGQGMTNNVAEYSAVLEAFRFASESFYSKQVQFYTDSQLVVKQVNGEWSCNSPNLLPLCAEASEWLS